MADSDTVANPFEIPQLDFDGYSTPVTPETIQEIPHLHAAILATAFSQGFDIGAIEGYIELFPQQTISNIWDEVVLSHTVFAYAINTGNIDIIKLCLEYGADTDSVDPVGLSLLVIAIVRAMEVGRNAPEVGRLLLSYGADPQSVPREMWQDYLKAPSAMLDKYSIPDSLVAEFSRVLNLTTRYHLWQADHLKRPTKRMVQIAKAHDMTALLRLPYQIIGQEATVQLVVNTVYTHIAQDTAKPLVLAFAGLSGHGKTELATQMGSLLSIPTKTIDCTHAWHQTVLLGSTYGYVGNKDGGPLNNFLIENKGERCVVFLDEFDKTNVDVHNVLLKVMDEGKAPPPPSPTHRRIGVPHMAKVKAYKLLS